jgi:hypothetical protein
VYEFFVHEIIQVQCIERVFGDTLETRVTGTLAGIEFAGNKTPQRSGGNFWLF